MRRKLVENWKRIEQRIADACQRFGRDPSSVKLVAVTKSVTIDVIRTLVEAGLTELGESRVQELGQRAAMLSEWLQRRARDTVRGARWFRVA